MTAMLFVSSMLSIVPQVTIQNQPNHHWNTKDNIFQSFDGSISLLVPENAQKMCFNIIDNIYGLMEDCSISSALAMEILQSCIKPSI